MRNNAAEKLLSTASAQGLELTEDVFAKFMDSNDSLREHREAYHFPKKRDGSDYVYLGSHALGLQHKDVESSVGAALKKWRDCGFLGEFRHPNPWYELDTLGRKEVASFVGAQEIEVITMNSYTVNLHLLLMAFYRPKGRRRKIMMENHVFPIDLHALTSQLKAIGMDPAEDIILFSAVGDESCGAQGAISSDQILPTIEKCGDDVAVIVMSAVHFITGQFFDIQGITKAAHAKGIMVGIDCAHAVGNVQLQLHDWEVDFASWCTYRYLNSGPGNLGGAFVHRKHTQVGNDIRMLRGWRGRDRLNRVSHNRTCEPAEGAAAFQLSNVPVLGMMALLPSVRLMAEIGMGPLREKSMLLTSYMELLLSALIPPGCIELITSVDPNQRGAQLSIRILPNKLKSTFAGDSYEHGTVEDCDAEFMVDQLHGKGVIVGHHVPDVVCLSPVPLYNSFMDVLLAVRAIVECF